MTIKFVAWDGPSRAFCVSVSAVRRRHFFGRYVTFFDDCVKILDVSNAVRWN